MTLSPMTPLLLSAISRYGQITASQLRRLLYLQGTPEGRRVRSQRHLARLTKLGMVRRIWGVYRDKAEFVYLPAGTKRRTPDIHALDITEIGVALLERIQAEYTPEPWSHTPVGHMTLKPDAYIDLGTMRYFLEMDLGSEYAAELAVKMRRYVSAYHQWREKTFPQILFVVHDEDRRAFIMRVVRRQEIPALFAVWIFDEAVGKMINSR